MSIGDIAACLKFVIGRDCLDQAIEVGRANLDRSVSIQGINNVVVTDEQQALLKPVLPAGDGISPAEPARDDRAALERKRRCPGVRPNLDRTRPEREQPACPRDRPQQSVGIRLGCCK